MVTGAAGSIGSELCRQIARFHPAGIVGFEIGESPLFEIDREMCQCFPAIPFHPEIGSIQNRARVDEVLRQYSRQSSITPRHTSTFPSWRRTSSRPSRITSSAHTISRWPPPSTESKTS